MGARSDRDGSGEAPSQAAREAWLLMSDLVIDNERRRQVSEALGISFARARALRRLARQPLSMGELAPPCSPSTRPTRPCSSTTSKTSAWSAAAPTPSDRRAKLVEATAKGKRDGPPRRRDPQHAAAGPERARRRATWRR